MIMPIYQAKQTAERAYALFGENSHYGVWFDRFFEYQVFKPTGSFVDNDDIERLINNEEGKEQKRLRAKLKNNNSEIYKYAKKKQKKDFHASFLGKDGQRRCGDGKRLKDKALQQYSLCATQGGQSKVYANDWLMAIGLGNSHPLENGLLWHPTLGVPYFQGSTVKGLAKALMEQWGADPDLIKRWFGSVNLLSSPNFKNQSNLFKKYFHTELTADQEESLSLQSTGAFIFLDAIPVEPVMIKESMVTPHYGRWYEKGDTQPTGSENVPGDWHSPVPVEFLAVENAVMQFGVMPRLGSNVTDSEIEQVCNVIELALQYLGIGAKTATGFGRMHTADKQQSSIAAEFKAAKQEADKQRALDNELKGASALKQQLVTQISENKWRESKDDIKTDFTDAIDDWLDRLEANPEELETIELMIEIFKIHYASQFKNPSNKKVKPRHKIWVERLKALLS